MQEAITNLANGVNNMSFINPELDLDYFTCGLLNYIPLDINSIIFSGGLLFDAYYCMIHQTSSTYNLNELKDIDLFLIGTEDKKIENTLLIIDRLKTVFGNSNVAVGMNRSVISIFISGFSRIIQLVCTNYSTAQEVIDNFDLAHVAMYYSNQGFYTVSYTHLRAHETG
jgi:hypothetical protein